jgi:dCTP deaminase
MLSIKLVPPNGGEDQPLLNKHELNRKKHQKYERFDIPFTHPFLLHTGTLALVTTLEWVKIPKNLQGIVTARSSWA